MILDTNTLSAWAKGNAGVGSSSRVASRRPPLLAGRPVSGQGVTCSRMTTSPGFQVWAMM